MRVDTGSQQLIIQLSQHGLAVKCSLLLLVDVYASCEFYNNNNNKCIGDDTKAAARQILNCIKNEKNKIWQKRFSICRIEFLYPVMWHVALES